MLLLLNNTPSEGYRDIKGEYCLIDRLSLAVPSFLRFPAVGKGWDLTLKVVIRPPKLTTTHQAGVKKR